MFFLIWKSDRPVTYFSLPNFCRLLLKNNQSYLLTHNKIKNAAHYQLLQEDQILQTISFNYNRSESNIEQFTEEELDNFITLNKIENVKVFSSDISINQNMENINKRKEFWKVLVLLSLLFITIEILLIKLIKSWIYLLNQHE